jgi:hypothetical protein
MIAKNEKTDEDYHFAELSRQLAGRIRNTAKASPLLGQSW